MFALFRRLGALFAVQFVVHLYAMRRRVQAFRREMRRRGMQSDGVFVQLVQKLGNDQARLFFKNGMVFENVWKIRRKHLFCLRVRRHVIRRRRVLFGRESDLRRRSDRVCYLLQQQRLQYGIILQKRGNGQFVLYDLFRRINGLQLPERSGRQRQRRL